MAYTKHLTIDLWQLTFNNFKNLHVVYGISSRPDGNMHLDFKGSAKNRTAFFGKEKLLERKVVSSDLAHGTSIAEITSLDGNTTISNTDGLITANKNILLAITVADCFPVYFFDPTENTVGLAHCGWRGTVGNLSGEMINKMELDAKNIVVGIGPGIQQCHFEVQDDILGQFKKYPEAIIYRGNKIFIDLPSIIIKQLKFAGVKSIENSGLCTYCHPKKYPSFRRDKPSPIEAMVAYIGLLS